MSVSTSISTSPPLILSAQTSLLETNLREEANSSRSLGPERWMIRGSSSRESFSPPRAATSSLSAILNIEPRQNSSQSLAAFSDHTIASSIGGAISRAISGPNVGPIGGPIGRPIGGPLGGSLGGFVGGPLGGSPSWSGPARSYPPPSSTFTPMACQTPKYPPWSTFDRSPRQTIDNNYHHSIQHSALPTVYPGARQLSFVPPRGLDENPELPKIDASSRPSVIQAMRSAPPSKSQRISESMEGCDRDHMNQPERNKSEENLVDVVGEAICDDQDAEIIMKYIHKKFSKYIL